MPFNIDATSGQNSAYGANNELSTSLGTIANTFQDQAKKELIRQQALAEGAKNQGYIDAADARSRGDAPGMATALLRAHDSGQDAANWSRLQASEGANGNINDPHLATAMMGAGGSAESTGVGQQATLANARTTTGMTNATSLAENKAKLDQQQAQWEHEYTNMMDPDTGAVVPVPRVMVDARVKSGYQIAPTAAQVEQKMMGFGPTPVQTPTSTAAAIPADPTNSAPQPAAAPGPLPPNVQPAAPVAGPTPQVPPAPVQPPAPAAQAAPVPQPTPQPVTPDGVPGKPMSNTPPIAQDSMLNGPPQPSADPDQDARLAKLPAAIQSRVKGILEGREAPPAGGSRSPIAQALINAAAQVEPGFDFTKWTQRNATAHDFASGKSSEMVRAANQTLAHVSDLMDSVDDLHNTSYTPLNAIKNEAGRLTDNPAPNNVALNAHAVADELSKVFKGANLSDSEIRVWENGLSPNMGPAQWRGAVGKLMSLLNGSLSALNNKRSRGMSTSANLPPLLDDQSQAILDKVSKWTSGQPTAPAAAQAPQQVDQAGFAALPSGSHFIAVGDPTNTVRVKP